MAHVGFAVSLPEHVERFDPVRRRVPGSRFVRVPGRWPGRVDTHRLVDAALRRVGAPAPVAPAGDLDLVLAHGECADRKLIPFLAAGGLVAHWVGAESRPGTGMRFVANADLARPGDVVVGDPRLDAARDPAAAARARAGLGRPDSGRPLVLVVRDGRWTRPWDDALARLRVDVDLVVHRTSRDLLADPRWPRALTGPGVLADAGVPYAELLAAADLCLSDAAPAILDASGLGRRTLRMVDGIGPGEPVPPGPTVDAPERLADALADARRAPAPDPGPRGPAPAVARLAGHLRPAYLGTGVGSR